MARYDVVKEYDWTSAPRGSAFRKKAPRVWVKSYKIKSNQIVQAIESFVNIAQGATGDSGAKEFYDKMYGEATIEEDDFNLPYFTDNIRSFSNTFGDTFQDGLGGSGGLLSNAYDTARDFSGAAAQLVNSVDWKAIFQAGSTKQVVDGLTGGRPGTYVETPMFYQFEKSDGPLQISFALSNTINEDSIDKNHKLIQRLTYINRPLRLNSIAVDPPRIFKVKVPGHRFIRWAYCSDFDVSMAGTRRLIDEVIVPEAYMVTMSFQSLTLEHAGFLKEA